MRTLSCLCICVVTAAIFLTPSAAFADGVVPESAMQTYPGMDPRLVGAPIAKTELTAALVTYSQAVEKVKSLGQEKIDLGNTITLLTPESVRAEEEKKLRAEEYDTVVSAYTVLIRAQYQELSSDRTEDVDALEKITSLRLSHQSATVSETLREWKTKAAKKKKQSAAYAKKVATTISDSQKRSDAIATELVSAKSAAQERKDVVREGIPVASLVGLDIPVLTMDAYLRAEKALAIEDPACQLQWWAMAGIGRAESNHGRYGGASLDGNGTTSPAIIGIPLNGNGVAAIGDSDQGRLDGDVEWDRAVGVMQFIPGTWNRWGSDGNGDGVIDPQNVYDAAMAAGRYLCRGANPDMSTPAGRRAAFLSYNRSKSYADFVEKRGTEYLEQSGTRYTPATPVAAPAG
jgi:membrane-bound lytic murein transglycosylase B